MSGGILDGGRHVRFVAMRVGVDEESVFPIHASAWSLVDVTQIDAGVSKHREHVNERSRRMLRHKHDGGAVGTRWLGSLSSEHKEPRDVVGFIANALGHDVDAVD